MDFQFFEIQFFGKTMRKTIKKMKKSLKNHEQTMKKLFSADYGHAILWLNGLDTKRQTSFVTPQSATTTAATKRPLRWNATGTQVWARYSQYVA